MRRYGLHGKLKSINGKGEELASILSEASRLISSATGCHLYMISLDNKDENCVWVTEVWDSKEDHDNSLKVQGVRELISRAIPIIDGPPEKGQELQVVFGIGDE